MSMRFIELNFFIGLVTKKLVFSASFSLQTRNISQAIFSNFLKIKNNFLTPVFLDVHLK